MSYVGRFDGTQKRAASPAAASAAKKARAVDDNVPTSTKWSVLSDRVGGLVAELSEVVNNQEAYCVGQSGAEGPAMCAVREKMLATPWGEEWAKRRTMFSYGEEMSTDPLEGQLLKQLVFMAKPDRILEIGMFVGYGSVAMMEGCSTSKVVSLEIDPYLKEWVGSCLTKFPDLSRRHEIVVGPALESLPKLTGQFDMIFVDANKAEYRRYVELILEHKLLSSSGVLVCDNVLYNGYAYVKDHFDAQPARRQFGNAIREFNQWVADHPKLEQVVLPIRDGISIIRQKTAPAVPQAPASAGPVAVTVVCCGAPKRGMGWYHCKQLLDGRVKGAKLAGVVEPFFLGAGKSTPLAKEFQAWAKGLPDVEFYHSVGDVPASLERRMVMICGRTNDNPRLFREAIDAGFSHIYLEKPGAPTVKDLEEMESYAQARGVQIYMGFNRNFSKYVKLAHDFMAKQAPGASLTLTRKDCFNTEEAVDECFERNAEGMLKNMMCHELMVLITYYGLTVDGLQEVIADQDYTVSEVRRGFKDFSRVKFTLIMKNGQQFTVAGDRMGGEHGEATLHKDGKAVFSAVRPDPEIQAMSDRLEKETPGCMPYFYLQDGEYLALKEAVVSHVLQGAPGMPEGVAGVRQAIDCLVVCDHITDAINKSANEPFRFELNIGNHPCSWGVDYADCPTNPPWDEVLRCIAESGYQGSELGPVGYYKPERLGGLLKQHDLHITAGNIFEKLHEPAEVPAILKKVHQSCTILKEHGAKFFVIVPHVAPERIPTTGRSADAPRLSDSQWKQFMDAICQVAEVCKSYGIICTLHPHAGCWIEYEDEVERAMSDLPADLVGLCLDSGHFTYAGMDPVEKYKKYAARVPYMHFKDINGAVLQKLRSEKRGFWDGIKEGVFCPLGKGLVNFPALLRAMKAHGFSGWVTVEQDADNSISDVQARLNGPFEACKLNVTYLRSLGVVRPAATAKGAPALSKPSFDLTGNHYIVTGGTQGLGLEIARQLKACGAARLALLSRSKAKGEAACAELSGPNCTAVFVETDMSDAASVQAGAVSAIEALQGRVDGLVNAAGTTERGNLMDTTLEMFRKQFDINTQAPFLLTQAVAKHLIAKKARGSIVNISSLAAKGGAPFIMAYSASKGALNVLTQNNATELAPHGIRVNSINMGWTYTENENALMVKKGGANWLEAADATLPLKRLMRPVDVACTALFLLSPASMMTTGNCYDLHPDTALSMLSSKTDDSLER